MAPHADTNASATSTDPQWRVSSSLHSATTASTRLDQTTSVTVTLLDSSVHLLPKGIFVPTSPQKIALLLGTSSNTLSGLFALPRVIDSDSNEEIKIMARTPVPPDTVPQRTPIL